MVYKWHGWVMSTIPRSEPRNYWQELKAATNRLKATGEEIRRTGSRFQAMSRQLRKNTEELLLIQRRLNKATTLFNRARLPQSMISSTTGCYIAAIPESETGGPTIH